ncbi:MAG: APC family permease [Acidobacteria bacterium]|nr:MAG: APC family permease [Acidobacteriota bacterium]REJ99633.1 MAG: APC family permease [Acidobacteriota bacterium]
MSAGPESSEPSAESALGASTPHALRRVLVARHVLALCFGAMIGWSWVVLAGSWVLEAGLAGATLALLVGGLGIVVIGLTYAELAAAIPLVGGEHAYSLRALGPTASFVCTWAIVFGYLAVVAFEAVALPTAVEYLIPGFSVGPLWTIAGWQVEATWVLVGVLGAVAMTWINVRGVQVAAEVQTWVVRLLVVSGAVLLVGALLRPGASGPAPQFEVWSASGWGGVVSVLVMVPFMFVGFDVLPQAAEEVNLPPRRIGTLLVASVLLAVLWYVCIGLAVGTSLDRAALEVSSSSGLPTVDAAGAAWAGIAGGGWAVVLLVVAGIAGVLTSWNAFLVGGSRAVFALAESGQLPAWFARLDERTGTPVNAVVFLGAFSALAPLFGRPALLWLVNAGGFGIVVAYAMVAISFLVLRWREPALERPFRAPTGSFVGWLALALSLGIMLLYLPGISPAALAWPAEWALVLGWTLLGVVLYLVQARGASPAVRAPDAGAPR